MKPPVNMPKLTETQRQRLSKIVANAKQSLQESVDGIINETVVVAYGDTLIDVPKKYVTK